MAAFEDTDSELCRPPVRAFMEQQVTQIAERQVSKKEVVDQNIELFHTKFLYFRSQLEKMERYFVTKEARDAGFSVLDNSKGWGGGHSGTANFRGQDKGKGQGKGKGSFKGSKGKY